MNQNPQQAADTEEKLAWIEPEVSQLDVKETAVYPLTGGDGYRGRADCTRS